MKISNTLRTTAISAIVFSGALWAAPASADIVQADDVIVQGSLCAGFDCVNGESFGFDTIRLKENNLRIHFQDTSTAASFPTTDWRLIANDSANGGGSFFAIEDATAGRQVFRVNASAPANALLVDSQGDVGIGESSPVVELHVNDGDTPTLRLEQDGSSGFNPQTWDMAGNEVSFFIRDVTGGSQLPFRIKPGAESNALVIDSDNNIGMGILSPDAPLHVFDNAGSGGEVMLHLENNGNPQILMTNTAVGEDWNIGAGLNLVISNDGGSNVFTLSETGDLTLAGTLTTTGSCSIGCDEVFDADYPLPSIEEQAELMFANSYLPNVGPTASGPIDVTQKTLGILNELEKAHIYIAQLHERMEALEAKIDAAE